MRRLPRPAHPDPQAASYFARVRPLLREMHRATLEVLTTAARVSDLLMDSDQAPGRGQRALDEARRTVRRVWPHRRIEDLVRPVWGTVDRLSRVNVARVTGLKPKDVPELRQAPEWAVRNAKLIVTVQDRYLDGVAKIVSAGFREGARWEDLSEQIQERYGVSETNADRIARTETSKLNAELTRERYEKLGVTEGIWRTVKDQRVRDEHESLEGRRYSLAAGLDGIWPGSEINCRCYSEPVLPEDGAT